ncbi:MAG TPA: ComEC/Rec2 family competence protein [Candidatus Paceibacterota bacterium]|nr:ComEC/Rec2 family competence protein [Candidatus Paceibacterota bacterium]
MTPLLALTSGLASGVFLRSLFVFGWEPFAFALLLAALCAAFHFLKPRRASMLGAVFFLCAAAGMSRMALADTPLPKTFAADLRHRVSYEALVTGDPDVRDASERTEIRIEKGAAHTKALLVTRRDTALAKGDRVFVSGTLLAPEAFAGDNGRVFHYDKYLARDGVRFILDYAYARVESRAPWYSLPAALARAKHAFLRGLDAALPEPYASLAGGIVIGGKSGLGPELQGAFTRSGLVQIIVLSGYNVMVVAEWVMAFLGRFSLRRSVRALSGALALVLFVGIAGATATSIRAALMALIALYARATGRTYAASRALLLAVALMLLWNPLFLAFDPGFDLSVAATMGLIWLAPRIEARLAFVTDALWRNAIATTLAAQAAVLPLLLYFTGNLSFVAVPANLIVLPVVPLAMGFSAFAGVAGALLGGFAPLLAAVLGFPAYLLTAFLVLVANGSAALPGAALLIPAFPFWCVLVAYAALAYLASSKRFSTTLQLRFAKKAST